MVVLGAKPDPGDVDTVVLSMIALVLVDRKRSGTVELSR